MSPSEGLASSRAGSPCALSLRTAEKRKLYLQAKYDDLAQDKRKLHKAMDKKRRKTSQKEKKLMFVPLPSFSGCAPLLTDLIRCVLQAEGSSWSVLRTLCKHFHTERSRARRERSTRILRGTINSTTDVSQVQQASPSPPSPPALPSRVVFVRRQPVLSPHSHATADLPSCQKYPSCIALVLCAGQFAVAVRLAALGRRLGLDVDAVQAEHRHRQRVRLLRLLRFRRLAPDVADLVIDEESAGAAIPALAGGSDSPLCASRAPSALPSSTSACRRGGPSYCPRASGAEPPPRSPAR